MNLDIENLTRLVTEWYKAQSPLPGDVTITVTISLKGISVLPAPVVDAKMSVLTVDFFTLKNILNTTQSMGRDKKGAARLYNALWNNYFNQYHPDDNIGEMTMGDFLKTFTERDLRRIPNLGMDSLKIFRHLLEDAQYPPLKET